MPIACKHLEQYASNRRFLDSASFTDDAFPDWQVTACFYAALHVVDSYSANANLEDPSSHTRRRKQLRYLLANEELEPDIFDAYTELSSLSIEARYTCTHIVGTDVERARQQLLPSIERLLLTPPAISAI